MSKGRVVGMATMLGVQIGILCHATLTMVGLSLLLYHFPLFFSVLSWVGACYLGYLGVMMIKSAGAILSVVSTVKTPHLGIKKSIIQGMLCNLLNPKVLILFLTIIPAFIQPSLGAGTWQIFILTLILLAFNIPIQYALVVLSHRIHGYLHSERIGKYLHWLCGGILLSFALGLIVNQLK